MHYRLVTVLGCFAIQYLPVRGFWPPAWFFTDRVAFIPLSRNELLHQDATMYVLLPSKSDLLINSNVCCLVLQHVCECVFNHVNHIKRMHFSVAFAMLRDACHKGRHKFH